MGAGDLQNEYYGLVAAAQSRYDQQLARQLQKEDVGLLGRRYAGLNCMVPD